MSERKKPAEGNRKKPFLMERLLRKLLGRGKEKDVQSSMWDSMQKGGYFRHHPVYDDWGSNEAEPPPVVKTDKAPRKVWPALLKDIRFESDEVVFSLSGDPMETFLKEIDPLLKETEELWLQKILRLNREMVVLDIGCGYGRTEEWMWRYVREVYGVDISRYVIGVCKKRFKDIDNVYFYYNEGDNLALFDSGKFDVVYSFNVFQHIPRRFADSYLKEINRVLKNDGVCLFNVLSGMNYDVDDGPYGAEWMIGYSHEDMKNKIIKSGLKVTRVLKWRAEGVEPHWIWFLARR